MLPRYIGDAVEKVNKEEKNQDSYKKCEKCGAGTCLEGRRICRKCYNNIVNKKRSKKSFII